MGETLPLRMGRGRGKTYLFSLGSILLRYLLLAIPVIMAIKLDQYNLFAVMAGIFLVQAFILGDHVYNHISSARSK
jgi:hypothetical protein